MWTFLLWLILFVVCWPIALLALIVGVSWFLYKTKSGLILRAVGDNHVSAHALGYPVLRIRMFAVMFGGACAGLAGAYLPLAYTPFFIPGMTAGRGWIALALVVFELASDGDGSYRFSPASALVLTELAKLVLATAIHLSELRVAVVDEDDGNEVDFRFVTRLCCRLMTRPAAS